MPGQETDSPMFQGAYSQYSEKLSAFEAGIEKNGLLIIKELGAIFSRAICASGVNRWYALRTFYGPMTRRGKTLYLHVFDPPIEGIEFPKRA